MEINDHISELDILVNLEYQLSNHHWTDIYQLMADLGVAIYNQIDFISEAKDDYPLIAKFAIYIQECRKDSRGSMDTYSPKMLSGYLYGRIKTDISIESLKHFAKYLIAIQNVDDNGCITINEEWASILSSPWGVPMEKVEIDDKGKEVTSATEVNTDNKTSKVVRISKAKTDAERRLEQFWFKLTSGKFDYQYFWRNKIDTDTYEELKNRLKECISENKRGFAKRYALPIALYISEWYKREYNGNDGNPNAIKAIGLSCRPEEIWNNCNFHDNYLSGQKNNRYLDSLYVLGGLPLNYLIHKQFNKIFKEISIAYKEKGDEETLQNNIFINNNTLQESMRSQWGSLHMFFAALMNGDYPFAASDFGKEPFRTFLSRLEEWQPMRKKFSIEWIIEGNQNVDMFRRKMRLYVTPEHNGERNKSISYGRLSMWGIHSDVQSFRLYVAYNDEDPEEHEDELEYLTFYNTHDNYFTAQMSRNFYSFTKIPGKIINKVTLYVKTGYRFKEVFSEEYENYMQLYETPQYSILSSRKSDLASYVLLPYSTKVLEPKNEEFGRKYFVEGGDSFKLIKIFNRVKIETEDGENHEFYRKDEDIVVFNAPFVNRISYQKDFLLKYFFTNDDGEPKEENVSVLFNKKHITVWNYAEFHRPEYISSDKYSLEYKSKQDGYYYPWTDTDQPSAGRVRIRITYHDFQIKQDYLYIPTEGNPIVRDCQNSIIKINKALTLQEQPKGLMEYDGNEEGYRCYNDSSNDEEQDCYNLHVFCGNGYVEIPVFRAINLEEMYFDGILEKTINISKNEAFSTEVPFLLKDHITIRKIDKNGVNYYNLKDDKVNFLDFKFEDDSSSIKNHVKISHGAERFVIDYYYCKESFLTIGKMLHIKDDFNNYLFYYWSMKQEDEPILISSSEDDYIKLDPEYASLKEGIIFQSLKPGLKPTEYYAPILLGKWDTTKFEELAPCCFNIAAKYHTPFRIFEPIYEFIKDTDSRLEDQAITFMVNGPKEMSTDQKMETLIRFSHEMYFSWPFLNRWSWKLVQSRLFEKIPQMERYLINKEKEHQLKEIYRGIAKNVFIRCGKDFTYENKMALNEFAEIYWKHSKETGYLFPSINDERWNGYDKTGKNIVWKVGGKTLEEQAVTFMRPFRKAGSKIVGFTYLENKKYQGENYRSIKKITSFLQMLYADEQSFVKILTFLKEYLFDYNH